MLEKSHLPKAVIVFCFILFSIGFISRIAPLAGGEERIFQHFPTEDGYLMLTIARNMALGLGMSTAEGTLPTNGTQPFTTVVWALGYSLTGADKLGGVIFAHIVLVIVSILFAIAIYKLIGKVFENWKYGRATALIASALVFSSPQLLPHTMNFLETGLYLALGSYVVYLFYRASDGVPVWSIPYTIGIGILLGILFLIRIDAVFIILSACLVHLFQSWIQDRKNLAQRFVRVLIFGSISVTVASPWLIYNYVNFGSIMPISGQALSAKSFAPNAIAVPAVLVEYMAVILPIPSSLQETLPVVAGCVLLLLTALIIAIYLFKKTENPHYKALFFMSFVVLACYTTYYGLFFGAKHFVARYFSITTPFLIAFTTMVILYTVDKLGRRRAPILWVGAAALVLVSLALNLRLYKVSVPHEHQQVISWVEANVADDVWVGAIQTGTLGYFHDRSINLDGKVNQDALKASVGEAFCPPGVSKDNCLMDYIVQSEIQYLADWQGIITWKDIPPLAQEFEVLVNQEHPTLGVFGRRNIHSE